MIARPPRESLGEVDLQGVLPRGASAPRRGAVLLETMLALGIFVAAGSLVLSIVADCTRAVARAERLGNAVDCARSLMAELEAGLRPIGDLAGGGIDQPEPPWEIFRIEARTVRSDFEGLVLAEISIFEADSVDAEPSALFSLRQLIPARPEDLEELDAFADFESLPRSAAGGNGDAGAFDALLEEDRR